MSISVSFGNTQSLQTKIDSASEHIKSIGSSAAGVNGNATKWNRAYHAQQALLATQAALQNQNKVLEALVKRLDTRA